MLYYLFDYFQECCDFPGAGLFQYISFRAAMAVITSLSHYQQQDVCCNMPEKHSEQLFLIYAPSVMKTVTTVSFWMRQLDETLN